VELSLKSATRSAYAGTLIVLACLAGSPAPAVAQQPSASPTPPRLAQDSLEFRGRAGLAIGSGARAYGMGGAFLARADDATAASWNPAGLSYLRTPEFSLVGVRNTFDGNEFRTGLTDLAGRPVESTEQNRSLGHDVDFAAVTYPLRIGTKLGSAQVSFQRVISFSGERTLETRNVTLTGTSTNIESLDNPRTFTGSGGFDVMALGTGFRLSHGVRLGATLNRWFNGYTQVLERGGPRRSTQRSNFAVSGWNANFGLMWSPWASLNFGLVGKSPFRADVALSRIRNDTDTQGRVTGTHLRSDDLLLDFPAAVGGGASWRPHSRLTFSVDYTRTFWSRGKIYNYFTLPATRSGDTPPMDIDDLVDGVDRFERLDYPLFVSQEDSEQVRAGAEFVIIRGRLKMPVRAGYFTDGQIVRDEDGVAPRFQGATAGAGLILGSVVLDVAVLREWGDYSQKLTVIDGESTPQFASVNDVKTTRVLMSIIYRHGGSN
jgi:hypothetical protein